MYELPPQWGVVSVNITNVAVDSVILAGIANAQIRVKSLYCSLVRTAAAGAFEIAFKDGLAGTTFWQVILQQPNLWGDGFVFPSPGVQLQVANGIGLNVIGTIAGPTAVRISMYYDFDVST